MKIELSQKQIVGMMIDHIKANGNHSSGTYNRADPTHYERGYAKFELLHGYTMSKSSPSEVCTHTWQEPKCENCLPLNDEPDPEVVEAMFYDCTWGVEFTFNTSIGSFQAYFDRGFGCDNGKSWVIRNKRPGRKKPVFTEKQFRRVFLDVLFAEPEGTNEMAAIEAAENVRMHE